MKSRWRIFSISDAIRSYFGAFKMDRSVLFTLIWVLSAGCNALFSEDLVLWDGEDAEDLTHCQVEHGAIISGEVCLSGHCLELVPDTWHQPSLGFRVGDDMHSLYRISLKNYDVIQFFAKTDTPGGKVFLTIEGWPQISKTIDTTPYIVGGGDLTDEYREVRVPTDVLKKLPPEYDYEDRCELISLETFFFGTIPDGSPSYKIYVDQISALKTKPPEAEYVGVHTASDHLLVVEFRTGNDDDDIPSQDAGLWSVNGVQPLEVGRYSLPIDEGPLAVKEIVMGHFIYLRMGFQFENNQNYLITTPYGGSHSFVFDDHVTRCESIKVNQAGYAGRTTERYAIFGIFAGDLGSEVLTEGSVPFQVLTEDGTVILNGTTVSWGDETGPVDSQASGEFVYRMDLSSLPSGGPYTLVVPGYGCSYPFGVGNRYTKKRAYVATRGLYHQRCGTALVESCTTHPRGTCHEYVALTDAEEFKFITELNNLVVSDIDFENMTVQTASRVVDVMEIHGGYHDAADFDRRPMHIAIPSSLLIYCELFEDHLTDGQYDLPESGNGIPDLLDEALWGVQLYEYLQTAEGGVRAGTETYNHPDPPEGASSDVNVYGTFAVEEGITANAAGLFAHASRLIRPYDSVRADALLARSVLAWNYFHTHYTGTFVETPGETGEEATRRENVMPQLLYAACSLYLATGEEAYHTLFLAYAHEIYTRNVHAYRFYPTAEPESLRAAYFMPYLIQTELPADTRTRKILVSKVITEARWILDRIETQAYPLGCYYPYFGWGASTGQGRFADTLIMAHVLSDTIENQDGYFDEIEDYLGSMQVVFEEPQHYYNVISALSDYIFGLNPLGKSFMTGIGTDEVFSILHADSMYQKRVFGRPNVPGILVFGLQNGLSDQPYQSGVYDKIYPDVLAVLPPQRRWSDGWSWVNANEFSTWETIVNATCLQNFLHVNSCDFHMDVEQWPYSNILDLIRNAECQ